jgi:serine protease Do
MITSISRIFVMAILLASAWVAQADQIGPEHFPIDTNEIDRNPDHAPVSYAPALAKITDSVVAVYTAKNVRVSSYDPREEMLRRFFGLPPQQDNRDDNQDKIQQVPAGQGSGVIVSSDGYILTNNHVISDRGGRKVDIVYVTLNDGEEYEAEIVGYDEKTDIAVLKIDADDLPTAVMADTDNLKIGDVVFAIGNPLGIGKTVTMGIISATGRDLDLLGDTGYESFIQTDAAINMGNSGGALVDAEGRLIGINTAIISQSGGNIGIGFAVPVKLARSILISLATEGEVRRGLLGVVPGKIDANLAESFGLESTRGAIVTQVNDDLPASRAGIQVGDIILEINGIEIIDHDHLRLTVAGFRPGTDVKIKLLRAGKPMTVDVKLADFDDPHGTGLESLDEILEGVRASSIDENLRYKYRIPEELEGVVITDVDVDSPYTRTLIPGIVLLQINGEDVSTVKEIRSALKPGINRLYYWVRGAYGFTGIKIEQQ